MNLVTLMFQSCDYPRVPLLIVFSWFDEEQDNLNVKKRSDVRIRIRMRDKREKKKKKNNERTARSFIAFFLSNNLPACFPFLSCLCVCRMTVLSSDQSTSVNPLFDLSIGAVCSWRRRRERRRDVSSWECWASAAKLIIKNLIIKSDLHPSVWLQTRLISGKALFVS